MKVLVTLGCRPEMETGAIYALETLLTILGVSCTFSSELSQLGLHLHYGSGGYEADVVIPADRSAPWRQLQPQLSWGPDGELPILHRDPLPQSSLASDGAQERLAFDLVAPTLWLLSRQEEIDTPRTGELGRFPASESWLFRNGLLETPLVNLYADLLGRALRQAAKSRGWPWVTVEPWPHGYEYAVCLAHDVDEVLRYNLVGGWRILAHSLKHRQPRGILRGLAFVARGLGRKLLNGGDDPSWKFDAIMALERSLGFRSSFYFVPLTTNGGRDPAYDVTQGQLSEAIASLRNGGWEVAVHGSFHSYLDPTQLARERAQLEGVAGGEVAGVRQHYLRLSVPQTFRAQRQAGFLYDSSLGHSEAVGFRAGIAAPFPLFDAERREALALLELPLVVMDGTLFWDLSCNRSAAVQRTLNILDIARQVNGLVTLLWHQRVVDEQRYPGWWLAYTDVLEHLGEDGTAWVAPANQVATWWQARRWLRMEGMQVSEGHFRLSYQALHQIDGLSLTISIAPGAEINLLGVDGSVERQGSGQVRVYLEPLSRDAVFHLDVGCQ